MASIKQKLRGGLVIGIGYMLSPLSWWNDVFFNLPIALAIGYAISWLHPSWFLPATLAGYWLSNVGGMVMMQFGATDIFWSDEHRHPQRDLLIGFGSSTLYTVVIVALVYWHVLEIPSFIKSLSY